ncbi:MAG: PIG-L family deacetylase, partial [Leptospiraceae bacterium]|nr:PIG-L family deacetylase [Leptospiraceae bacterium]
LTDGAFYGASTLKRNQESISVLKDLGIPDEQILFLNHSNPIHDTELIKNLDLSYKSILESIGDKKIKEIYCTAYEGGHPDHDATFLLALVLAKKYSIEKINQFFTYNSKGLGFVFFRVMSPVNDKYPVAKYKLTFSQLIKHFLLIRKYKSQLKTWIGLSPFVFIKYILYRSQLIQKIPSDFLPQRPHSGRLYYEKRNWFQFEEFQILKDQFLEKNMDKKNEH